MTRGIKYIPHEGGRGKCGGGGVEKEGRGRKNRRERNLNGIKSSRRVSLGEKVRERDQDMDTLFLAISSVNQVHWPHSASVKLGVL